MTRFWHTSLACLTFIALVMHARRLFMLLTPPSDRTQSIWSWKVSRDLPRLLHPSTFALYICLINLQFNSINFNSIFNSFHMLEPTKHALSYFNTDTFYQAKSLSNKFVFNAVGERHSVDRRFCAARASRLRLFYSHAHSAIPNSRFHKLALVTILHCV